MPASSQPSPVVTLTVNPAVDVSAFVERIEPERKLRCSVVRREAGGGGINVARALANLGRATLAIAALGGRNGESIEQMLADERVPLVPVRITGETRENFHITERATGLQFRFCLPGPALEESDGSAVLAALDGLPEWPSILVASGSLAPGLSPGFYAELARRAAARGARFALDASGEPLRLALARGVWLAKPSRRELEELLGQSLGGADSVLLEARRLAAEGRASIVVVSMGDAGAAWATAEGGGIVPAPTVRVASSVGAGDSLLAGLVLRLEEGAHGRDAVRFGVAAGAAATLRPGTALCARPDVERLLATMRA